MSGCPSAVDWCSAAWVERARGDEHRGLVERFEAEDVAQTARHAGASVGEGLDHRVALLRDLGPEVLAARAS